MNESRKVLFNPIFLHFKIKFRWRNGILILENKVPNCGIKSYENGRNGRLCNIPAISSKRAKVNQLRSNSFQVTGPVLFNSLPKEIRDIKNCSIDQFKTSLDSYLTLIPDEPKMPGMVPPALTHCAVPTNSLPQQIARARREGMTAAWRLPAVTADQQLSSDQAVTARTRTVG